MVSVLNVLAMLFLTQTSHVYNSNCNEYGLRDDKDIADVLHDLLLALRRRTH